MDGLVITTDSLRARIPWRARLVGALVRDRYDGLLAAVRRLRTRCPRTPRPGRGKLSLNAPDERLAKGDPPCPTTRLMTGVSGTSVQSR